MVILLGFLLVLVAQDLLELQEQVELLGHREQVDHQVLQE